MRTVFLSVCDEIWAKRKTLSRLSITVDKKEITIFDLLCTQKDRIWLKNKKIHRGKDKPAIEYSNGSKAWYQNSVRHRGKNKPALIFSSKEKYYFFKGFCYKLKKENGCKIIKRILAFDPKQEGILHSFCDLPSIIYSNGTKEWYSFGFLHRKNGPAIKYSNGDEEYWESGKRHRKGAPAVIYGDKQYWFENGEFLS